MNDERFVVTSEIPDSRRFVKVYHDFLDSKLLNRDEKMIFILLKRYLNFRDDQGGIDGVVYPGLDILADQCGMTQKTVKRVLSSLEEKGLITVKRRGAMKPNEYTLRDYPSIWKAGTEQELKQELKQQRLKVAESIADEYGFCLVEAKESESPTPTTAKDPDPIGKSISAADNKTSSERCQESVSERYTMEQIHQIYDYDTMVFDYPAMRQDVDTIMSVLYDALNTRKPAIRIDGEDKPAMIVVSKLMKLDKDSIMYAIRKYKDQTDRIRNVTAYILTMLYHAPEQYLLDVQNQFSSNQA